MSRPLRLDAPGLFQHVTSRGNNKAAIFVDEEDRWKFMEVLASVVDRDALSCPCYCLMGNHYHLVLRTACGNLSAAMRQLNGVYAQWWNGRHERVGHVLQGRFKAQVIEEEGYLLQACRYIARNPVRAGLVTDPADWPWSSYRATIGLASPPPWLDCRLILSHFGSDEDRARKQYARFVDGTCATMDAVGDAIRADVRVIGSPAFIQQFAPRAERAPAEIPRRERLIGRPSLSSLFGAVSTADAVARAIFEARHLHGYTLREIAAHLRLTDDAIRRIAGSSVDAADVDRVR